VDTLTFAEAQEIHEQRLRDDPVQDASPCVCCCMDCDDLAFEFDEAT
jgi:hypothetical protein